MFSMDSLTKCGQKVHKAVCLHTHSICMSLFLFLYFLNIKYIDLFFPEKTSTSTSVLKFCVCACVFFLKIRPVILAAHTQHHLLVKLELGEQTFSVN